MATRLKYGYKKTAECPLCKKAHEESGSSWNRELPKETIGHIQSAGCLGQKEVVTAAHNACITQYDRDPITGAVTASQELYINKLLAHVGTCPTAILPKYLAQASSSRSSHLFNRCLPLKTQYSCANTRSS